MTIFMMCWEKGKLTIDSGRFQVRNQIRDYPTPYSMSMRDSGFTVHPTFEESRPRCKS